MSQMKLFYLLSVLTLSHFFTSAQVAVGTSSPNATAKFQIDASSSTNAKGLLGPRVALTSTTANSPFSVTPATGLLVYNTATAGSGSTAVTPGYYSYNGSSWERLASPPTTTVNGTSISGFPTAPLSIVAPNGYGYGSLAEISLPPGNWEIIGDFALIISQDGFLANNPPFTKINTYWISDANGYGTLVPSYPLPLSSLSSGGPTSDASFTGSSVAVLSAGFVQQQMKFYVTNAGATSKTYYLNWLESYLGLTINNNDQSPTYAGSSGANRFYAVQIK